MDPVATVAIVVALRSAIFDINAFANPKSSTLTCRSTSA
jgi:hypothetical protein